MKVGVGSRSKVSDAAPAADPLWCHGALQSQGSAEALNPKP